MIAKCYLSEKRRCYLLIMIACFLVLGGSARIDAKTYKLRGKYTSEFQAVINKTIPDDTVYIPEGRYIVDSSVHIRHGLTILGAGASKTVIVFDSLKSRDTWVFRVKCSKGRIRFSGFSVKGCAPFPSSGILMKMTAVISELTIAVFRIVINVRWRFMVMQEGLLITTAL